MRKIDIPVHTPVFLYKMGSRGGGYFSWTCFPDVCSWKAMKIAYNKFYIYLHIQCHKMSFASNLCFIQFQSVCTFDMSIYFR